MIVKIQLPLATNDPDPKVLVYNEKRSFQAMLPVTDEIKRAMCGDVKAFFSIEYNLGTKQITHMKREKWQEW